MAGIDLTGRWTGVYFYPLDAESNPFDTLPPTPFDAEIIDRQGVLTGAITEPDTLAPEPTEVLTARLIGSHLDGEVAFTKHPDSAGAVFGDFDIPHAIEYLGLLSPDANSIAGEWHILGDWSGAFRMQRKVVSTDVAVERTAAV